MNYDNIISAENQVRMHRSIVELREAKNLIRTCILDNNSKIKEDKVKYELGGPECIDDIVHDVIDKLYNMDKEPRATALKGMIKVLVAFEFKTCIEGASNE
jgi:hypothetical protein